MRYVNFEEVTARFAGRTVAIVGSAPSVLENAPGFVDSHDIVVRVNNYKVSENAGFRCDVHHSFFGGSIKKSIEDLKRDGVTLCMNKCPDAKPIQSEWHEKHNKQNGIDWRKLHERRRSWWFCDTYIPTVERFLAGFELLGRHIPTSGFAAILDVLAMQPKSVYLTGFDFFTSKVHNVNEAWREGDPTDPICHVPQKEADWIRANVNNYPIILDRKLISMLEAE